MILPWQSARYRRPEHNIRRYIEVNDNDNERRYNDLNQPETESEQPAKKAFPPGVPGGNPQIGRASCRERV